MGRLSRVAGPLLAVVVAAAQLAPAASAQTAARAPSVGAPSAIVIDAATGETLYGKREHQRRAIASTTKLMTALVAMGRAKPGDVFAMPPYPVGAAESKLGLRTGERMTFHDLLLAMMLPSANDAAYDVAVNVGGSRAGFVRLMNAKARELGLTETHYSTPVGLDDPGNYSSAHDLAKLAVVDLRNPAFARIVKMRRARLRSGSHQRVVINRNTLVGRYPFVDGVKTGHTVQAGYVLVGSATEHGVHVVTAVLDTPSESARDANSIALLRWALAQFHRVLPVVANHAYARVNVKWHDGTKVDLVAARSFGLTVRRGARVERRVDAPTEIEGPLPKGHSVGSLRVIYRGRVAGTVPLVTASPVQGPNILQKAASSVGGPLPAIALVGLIGAAGALALRVRATRPMRGEKAAR